MTFHSDFDKVVDLLGSRMSVSWSRCSFIVHACLFHEIGLSILRLLLFVFLTWFDNQFNSVSCIYSTCMRSKSAETGLVFSSSSSGLHSSILGESVQCGESPMSSLWTHASPTSVLCARWCFLPRKLNKNQNHDFGFHFLTSVLRPSDISSSLAILCYKRRGLVPAYECLSESSVLAIINISSSWGFGVLGFWGFGVLGFWV